jgi:hypothetical protein
MPYSKELRDRIRKQCQMRIETQSLVPPIGLEAMKDHAETVLAELSLSQEYINFASRAFRLISACC